MLTQGRVFVPPLPNGVPGLTRTVGRTSNNSLSVGTTSNLPPGASYGISSGKGRVIFTQSVADWDFRGLDAHFLINADGITISQCLFDLSNYTASNAAFLYTQSATTYWTLQNCTIDGKNNTIDCTRCVGTDNNSGAPSLVDSNLIINWPADIFSGMLGVTGHDTVISNNYCQSGSSAISAFHTDGVQIGWTNSNLSITNNVFDVRPRFNNGTTVTSPLNLGRSSGFAFTITVQDNILLGPSTGFSIITDDAGGSPSGAINISRVYCADDGFGALNSNAKVDPILTMNNVFHARTGAARTFAYNNGSSTTTVSSIP